MKINFPKGKMKYARLLLLLLSGWFFYWIFYDVFIWNHAPSIINIIGFFVPIWLFITPNILKNSTFNRKPKNFSVKWKKTESKIDWGRLQPLDHTEITSGPTSDLEDLPRVATIPVPVPASKDVSKEFKPSTFKPQKVYHIHGFRTIKRIMAVAIFAINFIFLLGSFGSALSPAFTILFFANCFILLDYVWRTKKSKVEIDW